MNKVAPPPKKYRNSRRASGRGGSKCPRRPNWDGEISERKHPRGLFVPNASIGAIPRPSCGQLGSLIRRYGGRSVGPRAALITASSARQCRTAVYCNNTPAARPVQGRDGHDRPSVLSYLVDLSVPRLPRHLRTKNSQVGARWSVPRTSGGLVLRTKGQTFEVT